MLNTHALKNYSSINMECEFPVIMYQWAVLFLFITRSKAINSKLLFRDIQTK